MVAVLEKEDLKQSILKRLVYSVGKDTDFAVPRDWCVAVTLAVRERLMDRRFLQKPPQTRRTP